MGVFEVVERVEIAAPAESIWAYRLDYTHLPNYNPHVTGLERVDNGSAPGVGAQYRFKVDMGGGPSDSVLTVLEAVPYTRIVNDVVSEDGSAREVITVVPIESGSALELMMTAQLPDDVDSATRDATEVGSRALIRLELDNIKLAVESSA